MATQGQQERSPRGEEQGETGGAQEVGVGAADNGTTSAQVGSMSDEEMPDQEMPATVGPDTTTTSTQERLENGVALVSAPVPVLAPSPAPIAPAPVTPQRRGPGPFPPRPFPPRGFLLRPSPLAPVGPLWPWPLLPVFSAVPQEAQPFPAAFFPAPPAFVAFGSFPGAAAPTVGLPAPWHFADDSRFITAEEDPKMWWFHADSENEPFDLGARMYKEPVTATVDISGVWTNMGCDPFMGYEVAGSPSQSSFL
ncbi:hypothetical protein B0I37DRAFT_415505 [Chaetomium sp. MPI-CAGE-AT-0009]|nr:hypothetical protein B0I37DRAFT_415505 [Chaetomium sp. MPI-CAGE-AT-0009]